MKYNTLEHIKAELLDIVNKANDSKVLELYEKIKGKHIIRIGDSLSKNPYYIDVNDYNAVYSALNK